MGEKVTLWRPSRWNLNKLFGRLDIRTKLAVAFLGLSGLPLAVVGWNAADQHLRSLTETATQEQQRSLAAVRERVKGFLEGIRADLDLLATLSPTRASLEASADGPATADVRLGELLGDFLSSRPDFHRLRLFDSAGVELARVAVVEGRVKSLASGRWRENGFRYYSTLTRGLAAGEMAVAPVELRPERDSPPGEPAPDRPVDPGELVSAISFVRPIRHDESDRPGLLVADVYARSVLEHLQRPAPRAGEDILLIDPGGEYVFHSGRTDEWNTLLARRSRNRLEEDLTPAVAAALLGGGTGVVTEGTDAVVAYTPLLEGPAGSLQDYVLASVIPKSVVFAPVREVRRFIVLAGALTLLVAGLLALAAAHQFAAPIRTLTDGVRRLAQGEYEGPLEIDTNDEIEDLAESFSSMAETLQAREGQILRQQEELERYTEQLETMVEERTRELRRSQRKLVQQEKMVAVGQLAAGVAHELGTPLGTILCHTQMVQEQLAEQPVPGPGEDPGDGSSRWEGGPGAEARKSLDLVVEQVQRCHKIVRSLLDFSRPSTEERRRLDVSDLIRSSVELLEYDLGHRDVEVETRMPARLPPVLGNENELQQVLINLLRNAADAMPAGGKIEVVARAAEPPAAGPDGDGRWLRLLVRDEGEGIDPEAASHAFEPFFTTKAPGVGTGLGLWIVYNTVEDHGGNIEIDDRPGGGTEVSVTLPACTD